MFAVWYFSLLFGFLSILWLVSIIISEVVNNRNGMKSPEVMGKVKFWLIFIASISWSLFIALKLTL